MLAEEKNKHGPGSCCAPVKTTNTATTITTAKDREHAMNTLAHGVCASCGVTRMPVSFLSCFVLQLLSSVISMIFVFLFVCPGPDYCVCVCLCMCLCRDARFFVFSLCDYCRFTSHALSMIVVFSFVALFEEYCRCCFSCAWCLSWK